MLTAIAHLGEGVGVGPQRGRRLLLGQEAAQDEGARQLHQVPLPDFWLVAAARAGQCRVCIGWEARA